MSLSPRDHRQKLRRPASLKAATSALVTAAGGLEASAALCETSKSTVFKWGDDAEENQGRFIPAQQVRRLERFCGEPIVTRLLAAETGHALVALGEAALASAWGSDIAQLAKEQSEVFAVLAEGLRDGRLDAGEAAAAIEQLDEALAVGAAIRQRLRAVAEGEEEG